MSALVLLDRPGPLFNRRLTLERVGLPGHPSPIHLDI